MRRARIEEEKRQKRLEELRAGSRVEFHPKRVEGEACIDLKMMYTGGLVDVWVIRYDIKDKSLPEDSIRCTRCDGGRTKKVFKKVNCSEYKILHKPCKKCLGWGINRDMVEFERVPVEVAVRPGGGSEHPMFVPEEGNETHDGYRTLMVTTFHEEYGYEVKQTDGTLLMFARDTDKKHYTRLHVHIDITPAEAICGKDLTLTHLDGKKYKIRIPQNCYNTKVSIKGLGMPSFGEPDNCGDLMIHTNVVAEDRDNKELNKTWRSLTGEDKIFKKRTKKTYMGVNTGRYEGEELKKDRKMLQLIRKQDLKDYMKKKDKYNLKVWEDTEDESDHDDEFDTFEDMLVHRWE
jgi:DnaJ-class molecular chaperone